MWFQVSWISSKLNIWLSCRWVREPNTSYSQWERTLFFFPVSSAVICNTSLKPIISLYGVSTIISYRFYKNTYSTYTCFSSCKHESLLDHHTRRQSCVFSSKTILAGILQSQLEFAPPPQMVQLLKHLDINTWSKYLDADLPLWVKTMIKTYSHKLSDIGAPQGTLWL